MPPKDNADVQTTEEDRKIISLSVQAVKEFHKEQRDEMGAVRRFATDHPVGMTALVTFGGVGAVELTKWGIGKVTNKGDADANSQLQAAILGDGGMSIW